MGEELLLAGQAVAPNRLLNQDFRFTYPTLRAALEHEFVSPKSNR
jgi:NAD dependent epimerase/dehydratase family enzyme